MEPFRRRAKLDEAIAFIKSIDGFSKIDIKKSKSKVNPFVRLKIKHKKEIVTIGDKSLTQMK